MAVTTGGKVAEDVLPTATLTAGWSPAMTQVTWYRPVVANLSMPEVYVNWVTDWVASGVNPVRFRW